MPFHDDLMRQLLAAFEEEAREHLRDAGRHLVELERLPPADPGRAESIAEIFRLIHSLKGAARAVDLKAVHGVAHQMESLLGLARSGQLLLADQHFDLLQRGVDALQHLVEAGLAGQTADPAWLAVGEAIEATLNGGPPPVAVPAPAEAPAEAPPAPPVASTPPAAPAAPAAAARPEDETVRVATSRIDDLLGQAGELLAARLKFDQLFADLRGLTAEVDRVHRSWSERRHDLARGGDGAQSYAGTHQAELGHLTKQLKGLARRMARDRARLAMITGELQDSIQQLRVIPIESILQHLPRTVRTLAREPGKSVRVELLGGETMVDKRILEQLKDPLLHLVRNALDHGIEGPAERQAAGKPAEGVIRIEARHEGGQLVVVVADDGAGIDPDAVKAAALRRGLVTPADLPGLGQAELFALLFRAGFSTRQSATELSGRGVGLDVVRRNVDRLHGRIRVESQVGVGSRLILTLPLTVTATEGLLIRAGGQRLALPAAAVERILRVDRSELQRVGTAVGLQVDQHPLPVVELGSLLGLPAAARSGTAAKLPVVILTSGLGRIGLLVDELLGRQEMVVKGLGPQLLRVRHVAGATILGDGQPVVVLNPADLVRSATRQKGSVDLAANPPGSLPVGASRVLVVDDSITTRTLERSILEAAGYQVQVAADGQEAWTMLLAGAFDLVVTDVEMPRLDGFGLTERIRASDRFRELPVILVTSRDSRADKERGIEAGADAYIVKSAFDQESLLKVVRQFI